jgi:hypothetical protein
MAFVHTRQSFDDQPQLEAGHSRHNDLQRKLGIVKPVFMQAQAGEARLREIVTGSGFSTLRRAAETPFNIVLEAKV